MDVNMFAKKMTSTRSPLQVVSLLFSFGTFSRVIDFTCLGVAPTYAHCCACAATILLHVRLPLALWVLSPDQ